MLWLCIAGVPGAAGLLRVVSLELSEGRLFALAHDSEVLNRLAMGDSREHRGFCFPILDLEYAFLTFISYLQKLFEEYNLKMCEKEKGKGEISH